MDIADQADNLAARLSSGAEFLTLSTLTLEPSTPAPRAAILVGLQLTPDGWQELYSRDNRLIRIPYVPVTQNKGINNHA